MSYRIDFKVKGVRFDSTFELESFEQARDIVELLAKGLAGHLDDGVSMEGPDLEFRKLQPVYEFRIALGAKR